MPTIRLEPATHVAGILSNQADERGQLIVAANFATGASIALHLNLN